MALINNSDNRNRQRSVPVLYYILASAGILLLLLLIIIVREVLLLSFAAVLLAIVLDIPVQALGRLGLDRRFAAPIVLVGVVALFAILTVLTAPTLIRQGDVFVNETLPQTVRRIDLWLLLNQDDLEQGLEDIPGVEEGDTEEVRAGIATRIMTALGELTMALPSLFSGAASIVVSVLIVVFVTIFLLADPQPYREGLINLLPSQYEQRAAAIIVNLDDMMRRWAGTTLVSMIILGVGVWLGMMVLNVQEAALIGLIAGLSSFMPNFGPLIALVPALAVAITTPETNILAMIVVIYGLTFLQNQLLLPLMMSNSVRISPALITLGQVILGILFGFLGLLLAVPILAVLTVLIREVYIVDILDKRELSLIETQPVDAQPDVPPLRTESPENA